MKQIEKLLFLTGWPRELLRQRYEQDTARYRTR